MATIFREALIAPGWRSAFLVAAIAPNLLCGTLATPQAQPFAQTDWRVPTAAAYAPSLRTWNGQTNLLLIGQDQFFGAPGQPPQMGQSLLVTPRRLAQSWTSSLLQSTLNVPPPSANLFAQAQSLTPQRRGWEQNLLESTLAPSLAAPFVQTDTSIPRRSAYSADLRTWTVGVPITLLGKDTFFGGAGQPPNQLDWPLPKARARLAQNWATNLLETTLAPAVAALPFVQTQWLVPQRLTRIERSWLGALNLSLNFIPPIPSPSAASITVRAFALGYFDIYRNIGDMFVITDPRQYSPYWMSFVDTPPADWTPYLSIFSDFLDREMLEFGRPQ